MFRFFLDLLGLGGAAGTGVVPGVGGLYPGAGGEWEQTIEMLFEVLRQNSEAPLNKTSMTTTVFSTLPSDVRCI